MNTYNYRIVCMKPLKKGRPLQSQTAVYNPGSGIPITRANIELYIEQCRENGDPRPSPGTVVWEFAASSEKETHVPGSFKQSETFKRRLERATELMKHRPKRKAKKKKTTDELIDDILTPQ